jgi:small GTP-binding protein
MIEQAPVLKTVLIGEGGVGKTSIALRYTEDTFDEHMKITIGANFASKKVEVEGSSLTLMLWDLGGQPRFREIVSGYFRGAKLAIAVYDVTRSFSLERIPDWINRMRETAPECQILFVGNKVDARVDGSGVSLEEAKEFAAKYEADCMEVSAKSGKGVVEMFETAAKMLVERHLVTEKTLPNNVCIGG